MGTARVCACVRACVHEKELENSLLSVSKSALGDSNFLSLN